jgi:hypothetical protein
MVMMMRRLLGVADTKGVGNRSPTVVERYPQTIVCVSTATQLLGHKPLPNNLLLAELKEFLSETLCALFRRCCSGDLGVFLVAARSAAARSAAGRAAGWLS